MLTGNTHKGDLRIFRNRRANLVTSIKEITVETNPVHTTSFQDLVATHYGNVIFRLTSRDAGIATRAGVQINRHPPLLQLREFSFVTTPHSNVGSNGMVRVFVGRITPWSCDSLFRWRKVLVFAVNRGRVSIDS